MGSGSESPGIGGYPELAKPATRAMQGYRGVWFALLVEHRRSLERCRQTRRALRGLSQRKA